MTIRKKRIIVWDTTMAFLKSYIVVPNISSTTGHPIGGIVGTLKSLQFLCDKVKPDMIVAVYDGPGGSKKRRTIMKEYKEGRKPIRRNYETEGMSEEDLRENKYWQMDRFVEFLSHLPIHQFMFPETEADDVISYISSLTSLEEYGKIIVSSDKDFMQLCNGSTLLMRPTQNELLNVGNIIEQYKVHPRNMALARAIIGDASDNLHGVRGVGFKTLTKKVPFLHEDRDIYMSDIYDYCSDMIDKEESKLKIYNDILEGKDIIERNYKMMQLSSPMMTINDKDKVRLTLEEQKMELHEQKFQRMMGEDGFMDLNLVGLFKHMRRIVRDSQLED